MAWKSCSSGVLIFFVYIALLQTHFTIVVAKPSRYPIHDTEIRLKKDQCYTDIESGLWGWDCKSSMIAKENCALKCLSPRCYELVYESDPVGEKLEEGEKDLIRSQEYKYCMQRLSTGESIEGIKGSFNY